MITRSKTSASRNSASASKKSASRNSASKKSASRNSASKKSASRNSASKKSASRSRTLKNRPKLSLSEIEAKRKRLKTLRRARNIIGRNFQKHQSKIRANFLKAICSDSGVCLAFGKEQNKIKRFFHNFSDFSLVNGNARRLGKPSTNGFIYEIPYERNTYRAHAILKTSTTNQSDNLVYEYFVGQYINTLTQHYPCLVETYGLYQYKNPDRWLSAKRSKSIMNLDNYFRKLNVPNMFQYNNSVIHVIKESCKFPKLQSVLIQHFHDVESFESYTSLCNKLKGIDQEYTQLITLFHVYYFLHHNRENFTHYDLHTDNVLLYQPFADPDKKIKYVYHIGKGKTIEFQSQYVIKIIDYGRSYVKGVTEFYKNMCDQKECDPNCGKDKGYELMNEVPPEQNDFYNITSLYPNVSHDLRLYNMVVKNNKNFTIKSLKPPLYVEEYGTPPVKKNNTDPSEVCNVSDAYNELVDKMQSISESIPTTTNENIVAKITVYGEDKPMKIQYYQSGHKNDDDDDDDDDDDKPYPIVSLKKWIKWAEKKK